MNKLVSIVIRTFNESRYLAELLVAISKQNAPNYDIEVVIVDSGSTDSTIEIASSFGCRITHIKKERFTFGRSLNVGCDIAKGEFLVFLSGHCIPVSEEWLKNLVEPLDQGISDYSYGRQIGRDTTKFSEQCLFDKQYPSYSKKPQKGFFCNNANAALLSSAWEKYGFNEELTGLEDMFLAREIVASGRNIAYVSEAPVFHIHNEKWYQVKVRYEREAYALQSIMPGIHFTLKDFLTYFLVGVRQDLKVARQKKCLSTNWKDIIIFRFMHYWGTYKGNHEHRKLSQKMKYHYFYPKDVDRKHYEKEGSSSIANEGK